MAVFLYPVIYDLDRDMEANGVVHFFCSIECRDKSANHLMEGHRADGVEPDYLVAGMLCETCGKTL